MDEEKIDQEAEGMNRIEGMMALDIAEIMEIPNLRERVRRLTNVCVTAAKLLDHDEALRMLGEVNRA